MKVMRLRTCVAVGVSLVVLAGCAKSGVFVGGQPAPKVYKGIVSLAPGATEIASLTFNRVILGRTASCDVPESVHTLPIVTDGLKPNYEKIAALKPDVVVYDADLMAPADIAKFTELKIDAIPLGGDTVDQFCDSIYNFGKWTMAEMLGSTYVDKITRERSIALSAAPKPAVTIAFIMPGGSGTEHMIAGTEGFLADVARGNGSSPVGPKGKLFVPLNVESFMQMDPEVIMVAGNSPSPVLNDPRLKNLRAVRNKHVYSTPTNLALRKGAYVDMLIKRVSEVALLGRRKAQG